MEEERKMNEGPKKKDEAFDWNLFNPVSAGVLGIESVIIPRNVPLHSPLCFTSTRRHSQIVVQFLFFFLRDTRLPECVHGGEEAAQSCRSHNLLFYFVRASLHKQCASSAGMFCIPFLNKSQLAGSQRNMFVRHKMSRENLSKDAGLSLWNLTKSWERKHDL